MMPPEVLKELQPFVSLAAGLGRTAVQLVGGDGGFTEVGIAYESPRGDDLDTRLLRAMVIKARPSRPSPFSLPAKRRLFRTKNALLAASYAAILAAVCILMRWVAIRTGKLCSGFPTREAL